MRKSAGEDLRVSKTLANIHAAFRKLVLRKSYSELTVSALCNEAKIGRKTFYVYYESLDALFEATLESLAKKYAEIIKDYKLPDDARAVTRQFYLFSISQGKFYDNLVCSEHYQIIGGRLLMRLVRDTWNSSPWFVSLKKDEQDILLCFIYNTGASLYRQWVISGRKVPLEDMIGYADNLLAMGIEGFKNAKSKGN